MTLAEALCKDNCSEKIIRSYYSESMPSYLFRFDNRTRKLYTAIVKQIPNMEWVEVTTLPVELLLNRQFYTTFFDYYSDGEEYIADDCRKYKLQSLDDNTIWWLEYEDGTISKSITLSGPFKTPILEEVKWMEKNAEKNNS